ncbi:hypothetical protein ACFS5N_16420 [Mucilaginibacter ximonensis]|uniref:Uncharacterized protein n=1 Tax=Mucilaginibacter ximonensis TaxID=538021 RepID=A0ABW5YGB7_9SPHI
MKAKRFIDRVISDEMSLTEAVFVFTTLILLGGAFIYLIGRMYTC